MDFNDIRTTLQALIAIYDNANCLHTNAFDEAVTTPTDESVRRALAIQLIINREWGLAMNENPLQGSFIIDELTDLVEEAVLKEFDAHQRARRRARRDGDRLPARPHPGRVDALRAPQARRHAADHRRQHLPAAGGPRGAADASSWPGRPRHEKQSQLDRVAGLPGGAPRRRPTRRWPGSRRPRVSGENVFAVLMDAARVCSLQQVTEAFFEVGGQYRRNV